MKYMLVIRGLGEQDYARLRADIARQLQDAGEPPCLFASLPGEPGIEVVWIDEDMELKHLSDIRQSIADEVSTYDPDRSH